MRKSDGAQKLWSTTKAMEHISDGAQQQWNTWYQHEGKELIAREELTYLPFVNFIKRLGFNYE